MKKFSKIASILMALVLAVAAPLLFVGCKSEATLEEASKAIVTAARNYYEHHNLEEEKFDDLTLTFNSSYKTSGEYPLDYKQSAEAEEYTHGKFARTTDNLSDYKIVVKKVQRGAGNEAYTDYHLKVEVVSVNKEHGFETDNDDLLKEVNTEVKTTTTYVYASKVTEDLVEYYETIYKKVEEKDKQAVETKEKYLFEEGRDEYMASMNQYLYKINELVENSYFETMGSEYVLFFGNYAKDGNKMEMTMNMTMPQVRQGNAALVTEELYLLINGKDVDTVSVKMTMDNGAFGSMEMAGAVKYQPSAAAVELGDLTGYEAIGAEVEIDLPDGIDMRS